MLISIQLEGFGKRETLPRKFLNEYPFFQRPSKSKAIALFGLRRLRRSLVFSPSHEYALWETTLRHFPFGCSASDQNVLRQQCWQLES